MNEARTEALRHGADIARKRDRENGIPNPLVEAWKRENAAAMGAPRCDCILGNARCILAAAHEGGCYLTSPAREEAPQVSFQTTRQRQYVLLVDVDEDYDPPDVYGPFESVNEAAAFAENFREANDLPREATPENNEAWADRGWYFGIFELRK